MKFRKNKFLFKISFNIVILAVVIICILFICSCFVSEFLLQLKLDHRHHRHQLQSKDLLDSSTQLSPHLSLGILPSLLWSVVQDEFLQSVIFHSLRML
jgi:hypothetical protein